MIADRTPSLWYVGIRKEYVDYLHKPAFGVAILCSGREHCRVRLRLMSSAHGGSSAADDVDQKPGCSPIDAAQAASPSEGRLSQRAVIDPLYGNSAYFRALWICIVNFSRDNGCRVTVVRRLCVIVIVLPTLAKRRRSKLPPALESVDKDFKITKGV